MTWRDMSPATVPGFGGGGYFGSVGISFGGIAGLGPDGIAGGKGGAGFAIGGGGLIVPRA